ncbi:hypothetical protein HJC23_002378 [Cyclotella cryptica]|uniref:Uncharacterized protein n=1 Tax=Cyclotella cryptica TaxID=29204 RepID=A0ABD3QL17_9STRA|eukprot:CCRYP_004479-RA/>CCRYP_004479-RA protein AED:0.43 eAED:0.43 QI:0/-1/0/1/-1/1/1/0/612
MNRPGISSYPREQESSGPLSFLQCGTPAGVFLCDAAPEAECDYDVNPPGLYSAVHKRQWGLALDRVKVFPEEASIWVYRMGVEEGGVGASGSASVEMNVTNSESRLLSPRNAYSAPSNNENSYSAPSNNENNAGQARKVLRWRMLPLHAAIIFSAPVALIKALLKTYPEGCSASDDQGMLPLHLAFRSQSSEEVVLLLLDCYPQAIEMADHKGRVPSQLAPKNSTFTYHDVIADAFLKGPSYYYHAARVASADRTRAELEWLTEMQVVQENARKEVEEAKEVFDNTTNALNEEIEQLVFENSELKEKIEWYETKYDGAEEKEQVLVDHTNSLAERLRLTSLSEEHLATKLAKLEGKLKNKEQELEESRAQSEAHVHTLEERVKELESALEKTHLKAKSLAEKLQEKIQENNEAVVKFDNERKLFEKQLDASRECLMELISSSKEDKKMFDQDSKELRAQLQLIQSELSKNSQVPRSLEDKLENLQREIVTSRMANAQNKADMRREEAESMLRTNMQVKKEGTVAAPTPKEQDDCEIYVCQTRDEQDTIFRDYSNDADSLVALTELTDEQRLALENLDLSGTKEEIAATLSKVPGLTRNQVNLLVDVASSLTV